MNTKNVKIIQRQTGWSRQETLKKLEEAEKIGMKPGRYVRNEGWKYSLKELKELNDQIKLVMKEKKEELEFIKKDCKILKEEVVARKIICNKHGVKDFDFFRKEIYSLSKRDFKKYIDILEKLEEEEQKDNEFYIEMAQKWSGWTKEKVIKDMQDAKKIGISYKSYLQKGVYGLNEKQKESIANNINNYNSKTVNVKTRKYKEVLYKKTKWSPAKLELKFKEAKLNCSCSWEDYLLFKLYKLPVKKQKEYATLGKFDKLRIKYNEHNNASKKINNKGIFNEIFKDNINRMWFLNKNITYDEFKDKVKNQKNIFVKLLSSTQGKGINKYEIPTKEEELKELYNKIIELPESIVEEYIVQNEDVMKFCPTSVNTVRVTTLNYNGECKYINSLFRMGQGGVVDNFHAGGIAASINTTTGIVETHAVDADGKVYKIHPLSKIKIKGYQIPHWGEITKICEEIFDKVDGADLIGWDFAITPDGADLIEGNAGAYLVAQLTHVYDKKGLAKQMIEPYL